MTMPLMIREYFRLRLRPTAIWSARTSGYVVGLYDQYRVEGFAARWRAAPGALPDATCSFFMSSMHIQVYGEQETQHYKFDYSDPGFPESAITAIMGNCDKRFVPRSAV